MWRNTSAARWSSRTPPRATRTSSRRSEFRTSASGSASPPDGSERYGISSSTSRSSRRDSLRWMLRQVFTVILYSQVPKALSLEALDVRPDPDPDFLGGVLRVFASQHPRGLPVHEVRIRPDQPRKGVHVAFGSARDQAPVPGAHPWASPVEIVRTHGGRNDHRSPAVVKRRVHDRSRCPRCPRLLSAPRAAARRPAFRLPGSLSS